ncbi:hypothetical protein Leryth_007332 [Lithospermum erythrorhizon]|nr:hypothetical protein Leryth_007332 [Lithospermum erythrorhizon]
MTFLYCSLFFKQEMELSLIGLQNAGKTSLVNVVATGGYSEDMIPTVGFNMRKVTKGNVTIKLWDLGGQPRFRSMWERYCRAVSAIVYVVDAADHDNLNVSKSELHDLLSKSSLSGIPLLVLGNKIDKAGALSKEALTDQMDLKSITDREGSHHVKALSSARLIFDRATHSTRLMHNSVDLLSCWKMASSLQRILKQSRKSIQLNNFCEISRNLSSSSDALVEKEIKAGDIGLVSGIPQQHLRRKVVIFSPARTATQQGSGKVGKWKINFMSTQKWENPLMGWTSTGDPYANVGDSALSFDSAEAAKEFAERHGWDYTVKTHHTPLLKPKAYADNFKWKGHPEPPTTKQ